MEYRGHVCAGSSDSGTFFPIIPLVSEFSPSIFLLTHLLLMTDCPVNMGTLNGGAQRDL